MIVKELSAQEFENNILDLQMHGIDQKALDKMRAEYYDLYPEKKKEVKKAELPSLMQLRSMGLKINKPNKTIVNRKG